MTCLNPDFVGRCLKRHALSVKITGRDVKDVPDSWFDSTKDVFVSREGNHVRIDYEPDKMGNILRALHAQRFDYRQSDPFSAIFVVGSVV